MTQALTLVTSDTEAPADTTEPSSADKIVLAAYIANLKKRGFCKIDDSTSQYTRLFNRFDGKTYFPSPFFINDFPKWLKKNKTECTFRPASYITYTLSHIVGCKFIPNGGEFYEDPRTECLYVNTCIKYSPTTGSKDVSPLFLEYFERIVPDQDERHIFIQWLAHIFQKPQDRPSWHVILTSDTGTGKGFLIESILHPLLKHTSTINSYSRVMTKFSTVLADNLLVLLDDPAQGSDDTQTQLKSLLSEERAYCEGKFMPGGMVQTYTRFILASNDPRPLRLDENERRWWSPAELNHRHDKVETQKFLETLANWLALDGSLCAVYNWFMAYDLGGFNAKHIDQSDNLKNMIGMSANIHAEFLKDYISEHVVFTHAELMEAFDTEKMQRPNPHQVPHLLREAEYTNGRRMIGGKLVSLCYSTNMTLEDIGKAYLTRHDDDPDNRTQATPF